MVGKAAVYARALSLAVAVLVFTSVALLHVPLVHANPIVLSISPSSAPVGETVTATGSDASANGEVRLYLSGNLFLASDVANETGGYSVVFTVPAVPCRIYSIMVVDISSGDTTSGFFAVESRIMLTPVSGSFDNKVTVVGDGFAQFSNVTLWFEGVDVTPDSVPHTNNLGSFQVSFNVPNKPSGTYTFAVSDMTGNTVKTSFDVVPKIVLQPTSGIPSAFVYLIGYGFGSSVNATVHFGSVDVTNYPYSMTLPDGVLIGNFFVPDVPDGTYILNASDSTGNFANAQFTVPSPTITLTPDIIAEPSVVEVKGVGFQPHSLVVLYLENIVTTNLLDLMWSSENVMVDSDGSFEYSFIVPVTEPGLYDITVFQAMGTLPSDLTKTASATLTIAKNTELETELTVGPVLFRGELAEFYLTTALEGELVDVQINRATIYYLNGSFSQDLSSSVSQVSTGFYRIAYSVSETAPFGTYALLVEASLQISLIKAFGTTSASFIVSPTLTTQMGRLLSIENKIATIVVPDLGTIKANLTAINATLVSINGSEAIIESMIGTLTTDVDTIHARVTSIDGNVATVSSDLGTMKLQTAEGSSQASTAALLALVAAIASSVTAIVMYKRKPPQQQPSPPPPTEPPPPESVPSQKTEATSPTPTEAPIEPPVKEKPAEAPAPQSPPQETPPEPTAKDTPASDQPSQSPSQPSTAEPTPTAEPQTMIPLPPPESLPQQT